LFLQKPLSPLKEKRNKLALILVQIPKWVLSTLANCVFSKSSVCNRVRLSPSLTSLSCVVSSYVSVFVYVACGVSVWV
jgi:hypothetical protein